MLVKNLVGSVNLPKLMKSRPIGQWDKVFAKLQDVEPAIPREPTVGREVRHIRENLPIFEKRQHVIDTINSNQVSGNFSSLVFWLTNSVQVTIISSETGSGKTTQVPQYIIEDACYRQIPCKIICTQPRRISTISAAERVSYERGESVGASVGYHIRLDSKSGKFLLHATINFFWIWLKV